MHFLGEIPADELEEIQQALATLNHHQFFQRLRKYRTEVVVNSAISATDEGLPPLIRKYQAEALLLGELDRMGQDAANLIKSIYGDSHVSDTI